MPCFHGLAVSIHTPDGPLSEYSIQRQSKFHRITAYIPVPPARIPKGSSKPEQSTFAISITLLTPGLNVPYSTPKPTPDEPYPRPKIVGGLPGYSGQRGKFDPIIGPYIPLTSSPNETIAAYIYFDGRAKEEVATLLRRGEETWVNSRWVSVPDSEGGGLAEREFLFREVGLERWLNGLDLVEGKDKDVQARIERRRQRLEKKRRVKKEINSDDDDMDEETKTRKSLERNGVLRYGDNKNAPVESLSGDETLFTSDSDSEDDPPMPEAAGQIKVALFRVLASGEIKRGEYSPQFDAHDDDETSGQNGNSGDGGADVDHTTSFAKPKTLDPKSISTQTVTGIDPPNQPYAVFTFLYRGERQLRKMGIVKDAPKEPTPTTVKRKSGIDFSNLPALTTAGTKNFAGYRDPAAPSTPFKKGKAGKKKDEDAMDSDADDDDDESAAKLAQDADDVEIKEENKGAWLSPDDAAKQAELAEGVRKIRLKRQHSAEPVNEPSPSSTNPKSSTTPPATSATPNATGSENGILSAGAASTSAKAAPASSILKSSAAQPDLSSEASIGSPFKKQRASLPGFDDGVRKGLGLGLGASSKVDELKKAATGSSWANTADVKPERMEDDEEL